MSNDLGRRIKAARERRGWTQAQLGLEVGVGARTVGGWERGETTPMNRMGKLEEVLGPGIDTEAPKVQIHTGAGKTTEISVMFANFENLTQMELLRLSRLIQDVALGGEGDG
jgi:transcriptional regulator with XRE-family HTH domain